MEKLEEITHVVSGTNVARIGNANFNMFDIIKRLSTGPLKSMYLIL